MRSMVEFKSFTLSEYLVRTWLVDLDKYKFIEFAMLVRKLLWTKWKGKIGFQLLSLITLIIINNHLLFFIIYNNNFFKLLNHF